VSFKNNEEMGLRTWEDVERCRQAYADASICCRCGVAIPRNDPVWMIPCRLIWPLVENFYVHQDTAAAGCATCARGLVEEVQKRFDQYRDPEECWKVSGRVWPTRQGPCPGCGRQVHLVDSYTCRYFCSDRCRNKVYGARYRELNPRPKKCRVFIQCVVCGENFAPRRADAKTCSPACRQKAYRKRVTDNCKDTQRVPFQASVTP
jgi:hypothetical protein